MSNVKPETYYAKYSPCGRKMLFAPNPGYLKGIYEHLACRRGAMLPYV